MIVLSLQGGMAVGKTTAARYLARHAPDLHVCLEDNRAVIGQVQRLGLDKTRCDDYIRIQRLWLQHEVDRWQQARPWPCTVMDFGAEEIEFYTLHYPRTIGQDWDVEGPLARELAAVRRCMPRRILFLDAPDPVLRRRKEGDAARDRGAVLCGVSAGAICWCRYGNSDSRKFTSGSDQLIKVSGLGYLPVLLCPHYDAEPLRQTDLPRMMRRVHRIPAIALDNGAALEAVDGRWRILTSLPGAMARRCFWRTGSFQMEELPQDGGWRRLEELTAL